ncbi:MAG TPA: hypothetical protein VG448_07415 [Solirubrobacterales bacterium]|nr:hypothetical protein [Solirubrobacterales bacterium]
MLASKAGPCPRCGGWGSIPDGTYHFAQEVEAVVAPWSPRERRDLANELSEARRAEKRRAAEGALRKRPGLGALADRYLKPKDANSFWALVAVILMVLTMAGVGGGGGEKVTIKERETIVKLDNPSSGAAVNKAGGPREKRPPPSPKKSRRSSSKKRGGKKGRGSKKKNQRRQDRNPGG